MLANSLIVDGDFDVRNDYVFGRYHRYHQYFAFPIDPHVNTKIFTSAGAHWYSQHGVGLAAVLTPGVVADDVTGATVTMVVLAPWSCSSWHSSG